MKKEIGLLFIFFSLLALLLGLIFGTVASFQFIYPGLFDFMPFFKNRPLHVSLVVSWIFLSAVGGIYYYLPRFGNINLYSLKMAKIHLWIFLLTGVLIITSYVSGKFGGREYWEFPAIFSIPIIISWILFGINYFKTVIKAIGSWPVYYWMWGTGICFFLYTFIEAYLWVFPYFRDNLVRDVTVQWKAYGALVGSWNMLVYGTAIFLMEKIKGDDRIGRSKLTFLMYLLGLTNLMFGWAHHIYIVPNEPWIRHFSYAISMTELLILAKIIINWKNSLEDAKKDIHITPYRFLVASDVWVFLNLTLALVISVPAINIYTHGTHITVAHAMGSTIGINTMILLCSATFIINDYKKTEYTLSEKKCIHSGFWITNISLLVFWISLLIAGTKKGVLIVEGRLTFQEIMTQINPYLTIFAWAGTGILLGLILVVWAPLKHIITQLFLKQTSYESN